MNQQNPESTRLTAQAVGVSDLEASLGSAILGQGAFSGQGALVPAGEPVDRPFQIGDTTIQGSQLELPANFPVPLTPEMAREVQSVVDKFSFRNLALRDIPQMGLPAEMELGRALDGFLSRIDKQNNPQLFRLTNELTTHFEDAKLEEVADRILNAKPSLWMRIYGLLNPRALRQAAARVYEDVARIAAGRSKTLSDHVSAIESKLKVEMQKVSTEMTHMDNVKAAYRNSLVSFALFTAILHNALLKARQEFALMEPELQKDPQALQDAQDKLQALESRALAIEGTLTKLPADQIVIRQLQNAGIGTLQELSTTMAGRFSSIKMELLIIHGALMVQGVQRLGEQGANLDANLGKVRAKLMNDVVTTAAAAPGKNREAQAKKLQDIVKQSQDLYQLTEQARAQNKQQFETARQLMAQARQDLLALGQNVNPGRTVAGSF